MSFWWFVNWSELASCQNNCLYEYYNNLKLLVLKFQNLEVWQGYSKYVGFQDIDWCAEIHFPKASREPLTQTCIGLNKFSWYSDRRLALSSIKYSNSWGIQEKN